MRTAKGPQKDPTNGDRPFDMNSLMAGIMRVESSDGVNMMNPTSTATGKYGQLFSEIEKLAELDGITREQFAEELGLQDQIFGMRAEGLIPGIPGLIDSAFDLTEEYSPQLDSFDYRPDEVAALVNYLGRQGTRNYFASLRDGTDYEVPGTNKTPEEYLEEYNVGVAAHREREGAQQPTRTVDTDFKPIRNDKGGRVLKYNNGRPSSRDTIPQYSSMEEYMSLSPYERGGSGAVESVFGPMDYVMGAFPLGRVLSPAAKAVGRYLGVGKKATPKIPYEPIDITDAKNLSDFPADIPSKQLGSEYEYLINEIMDDYSWDTAFRMKGLFNQSAKELAEDKRVYDAVMKRVEDLYTADKGGRDMVSALLNVKESGPTLNTINKIRTEAIEEVADEFRRSGNEIDMDRFVQESAKRVRDRVKEYAASQLKDKSQDEINSLASRQMFSESATPYIKNDKGGRVVKYNDGGKGPGDPPKNFGVADNLLQVLGTYGKTREEAEQDPNYEDRLDLTKEEVFDNFMDRYGPNLTSELRKPQNPNSVFYDPDRNPRRGGLEELEEQMDKVRVIKEDPDGDGQGAYFNTQTDEVYFGPEVSRSSVDRGSVSGEEFTHSIQDPFREGRGKLGYGRRPFDAAIQGLLDSSREYDVDFNTGKEFQLLPEAGVFTPGFGLNDSEYMDLAQSLYYGGNTRNPVSGRNAEHELEAMMNTGLLQGIKTGVIPEGTITQDDLPGIVDRYNQGVAKRPNVQRANENFQNSSVMTRDLPAKKEKFWKYDESGKPIMTKKGKKYYKDKPYQLRKDLGMEDYVSEEAFQTNPRHVRNLTALINKDVSGSDPMGREEMRNLMNYLNQEGYVRPGVEYGDNFIETGNKRYVNDRHRARMAGYAPTGGRDNPYLND